MNICEGKKCINVGHIGGDCHISCGNPPKNREEIGSGGNERYEIADSGMIKQRGDKYKIFILPPLWGLYLKH